MPGASVQVGAGAGVLSFPRRAPRQPLVPAGTYSSRSVSKPQARQGAPHPPARVTRVFPRGPPDKKMWWPIAVQKWAGWRLVQILWLGRCFLFSHPGHRFYPVLLDPRSEALVALGEMESEHWVPQVGWRERLSVCYLDLQQPKVPAADVCQNT